MNESDSASTEPWVSALTTRLSSWNSPRATRCAISSSDSVVAVRRLCSRCNCVRLLAMSLASCSVSMIWNESPACGAPLRPRILTGSDGAAFSTRWLRSLNIALIRPQAVPAITISPCFRVPLLTSTVEVYPRPLSSEDSITEPVALRLGFALRSSISASSSTFSISSCTPIPFLAEIS